MPYDDGLRIRHALAARRAVAHVPDGHVAFAEFFHNARCEHVVDQSVFFMNAEHPVVVDDDARRFLPAVLQGEKSVVSEMRDVRLMIGKYPENAAFFVDLRHRFILPANVSELRDMRFPHRPDRV